MAVDTAIAEELFFDEFIVSADGINLEYKVGCLDSSAGPIDIAILGVGRLGHLVCVPGAVWDKKASKRLLDTGSLSKPISLSIPACTAVDRVNAADGLSVHVWLGWLKADLLPSISFPEDLQNLYNFEDKDTRAACFPYADGLAAAAYEKFGLKAPEDLEEEDAEAMDAGSRLTVLEENFSQLKLGLDELLALQRGGSGYVTAQETPSGVEDQVKPGKKAGKAKALSSKPVGKKASPPVLNYPGLDPSAVAAALQAGVPAEHLTLMSRAIAGKPRLGEQIALDPSSKKQDNDLQDSEAESDPDGVDAAADPMTAALLQLTKIVSKLSASKKADPLEDSMDFSGASGSADGGVGLSRKHAAVIRALKKAFKEDPKKLWTVMEANMQEDYALSTVQPNTAVSGFSVRGWAEHRSKIQSYPRTVRSVWGLAGVMDAIRAGATDEALCRCYLLMAQYEQESIDRGSFLLAQEFALEPPAPISSFANHVIPEPTEMAYTRILDSRWVEAFAHHLKDVDTYMEMRKKLGQKNPVPAASGGKGSPQPKSYPKAAAKAKGKGVGKKGQESDPALEPAA